MNFPPTKAVLIEHPSMPREPCIKLVVFGDRCWLQTLSFHPHVTGAGKRLKQVDGVLSGHCCQKLLLLVRNSSIGSARKDAENNARVASLHSDVPHSAYVMVSVQKINILSHKWIKYAVKLVLYLSYLEEIFLNAGILIFQMHFKSLTLCNESSKSTTKSVMAFSINYFGICYCVWTVTTTFPMHKKYIL